MRIKGKMNLTMATVLVLVNMVGTGIFLLPVSMASVGSISIYGWVIASIGAIALGLMFSILGAIKPLAGGPYAYAREALGPYIGFQTNYVYWTANLVGNVAIALTVTGYFTVLIPQLSGMVSATSFTIFFIWLVIGLNIAGPRWVGYCTGWSTALAMIPLVAIAIFGWYWFNPQIFLDSWNPHHTSEWSAVSTSAAFALWAFMGIESAAVAANVIENPKRNIPLATMIALVIACILYVSTCTILMGIIPATTLAKSSAPFSDAAIQVIGSTGGIIIAICAILKAGSSLVGWTLTISQSAEAAAADGLFPKIFGYTNTRGIPVSNLIITGILMTIIAILTASPTISGQFDEIIDISIILTVLPYLYTGVAFLTIGKQFGKSFWHYFFVSFVVLIVSTYCLWVIAGADAVLTRNAMIILFISVPLYPFFSKTSAWFTSN